MLTRADTFRNKGDEPVTLTIVPEPPIRREFAQTASDQFVLTNQFAL